MLYRCRVCGYEFDEKREQKEINEIDVCPNCGAGRIAFQESGGVPWHKGQSDTPDKVIGIYHNQYYRGACKLCYRHFIQGMVEAYNKCYETARKIYGDNIEFKHFTDFGQYSSDSLDRPHFHLLVESIEKGELDVVMCFRLNNITTNEKLLVDFYKYVRGKGLDFITESHGLDAMKYIDLFIQKQEEKKNQNKG